MFSHVTLSRLSLRRTPAVVILNTRAALSSARSQQDCNHFVARGQLVSPRPELHFLALTP